MLPQKEIQQQSRFFLCSVVGLIVSAQFILFVVEESVAYGRIHNLRLSWQRFWKLMHEGLTDLIYCLSGPFPQVRLVIYYCFFCLVWFLYDKKKKKRERSRYKTTTTATKRQLIIKDHKSKGFEKRFKHTNRLSWMIKQIRTVLVAHFLLHLMFVLFLVSFLCHHFKHVCKIFIQQIWPSISFHIQNLKSL